MKKIFLLLVLCSFFTQAQNEFLVNTYQDTVQRSPVIAKDGSGNYVVVWQSLNQASSNSGYDIYLQLYNASDQKVGGEILVNQISTGIQEKPSVAMSESGKVLVAWSSYISNQNSSDIFARLFQLNVAATNELLVNSTTINAQTDPAVAVNNSGDFVITWASWDQDGGDRGVYRRKFSSSGIILTNEILVNQTTAYSQAKPRIKYFTDDRYIIVWESFRQDGDGYGVYGRIFNSDDSPVTNEFQINTNTIDYQWFADVETFDDNSFVVVWCSWEQDGYDGGIYFQRFNSSGAKVGNETLVNKSTSYYQWLPKVKKLVGNKFAVVWSSWKQDGSREGVYTIFIDENNKAYTFETQVNQYGFSFQWEPDFIVKNNNEILAVWASWQQFNKDYDILARRIRPEVPQGVISSSTVQHISGKTSGRVFAHVVDSTALNGHTYQVTFDTTTSNEMLFANITDITTSQSKIQNFPVDRGKGIIYTTPVFDGLAVEIFPEYKLEINGDGSYFINHSGSNLMFAYGIPSAGQKLIAPIDVALIWGSTATVAGGAYANPSDTALSTTGQPVVIVPFNAKNITDNTKVKMLVKENTGTINNRWDAGETVVFLTPSPYSQSSFNTHAQIATTIPSGAFVMPNEGDTNIVLTRRPITPDDKFNFVALKSLIVSGQKDEINSPYTFCVLPNYPNPFNPSTTIKFSIPYSGKVKVVVYDILGRLVTVLAEGVFTEGFHRLIFNANSFASGAYIYSVQFNNKISAHKMLLLK
ncbi:MAG: T9SS type A sorting domain-containing protein [Ignavibacteriaceae bacterium]|nr:T9SS type A sorting domain-containing protein [Ignavibacteriaceae bacterium]